MTEGRRVTSKGPAHVARPSVGIDSAESATMTRITHGPRSQARTVITAETAKPSGVPTAAVQFTAAVIAGTTRPTVLTTIAPRVAALVLVDGQLSAADTSAARCPDAVPGAPSACPDVAASFEITGAAYPCQAGVAATALGGVGRVLEAVGRTSAARTTTWPTSVPSGSREGRAGRGVGRVARR